MCLAALLAETLCDAFEADTFLSGAFGFEESLEAVEVEFQL